MIENHSPILFVIVLVGSTPKIVADFAKFSIFRRNKKPNFRWVSRDPDRIRTCDRLLRRQLLYPTELRNQKMKGQLSLSLFVGVAGFEPTTSCSQSRRDTGLRYTPSGVQKYKSFMPSKTFHF